MTKDYISSLKEWQEILIESFEDLEKINICIIGHVDHGKTLISASIPTCLCLITEGLSEKTHAILKSRNQPIGEHNLDKSKEERERKITIRSSHIQVVILGKRVSLTDCPGHADFVNNIITNAENSDVAVLVVSVGDGVIPQTQEHVLLAKQIGIRNLIVLLNKVDSLGDSQENIDTFCSLAQSDVEELLKKFDWPNRDKVQYIRISALKAIAGEQSEIGVKAIYKLVIAIEFISIPKRNIDREFVIPIVENLSKSGRGSVATGLIVSGRVKPGQEVILVGYGKETPVCVKDVQIFRKGVPEGVCGDNVGVLVKGLEGHTIVKEDLTRGKILVDKGSYQIFSKIVIKARVLLKNEGGREQPFEKNYQPQFHLITACVTGVVERIVISVAHDEGGEVEYIDQPLARPGGIYNLTIKLIKSLAIPKYSGVLESLKVTIRSDKRTIATGIVVEYL